uniref:Uncharacterized protein n=1 Tax=Cannabis sativa TaxID=3483 RepID=A0A803NQ89_CANSA
MVESSSNKREELSKPPRSCTTMSSQPKIVYRPARMSLYGRPGFEQKLASQRRTPAITSTSSSLPQDPMAANPNVCVPITTRMSTNPMDVANLAISASITNLATATGHEDTTNPVGLNGQPLPPTEDPPLAPHTEGMANMEQPPSATMGSGPQYYVGETGLIIGEAAIGEPHIDLGQDLELARFREAPPANQLTMGGQALPSKGWSAMNSCQNKGWPTLNIPSPKGLTGPKPSDLEQDRLRDSPVSAYINALPVPKFKIPTWKMYTGKEDPLVHLKCSEI